MNEAETRAELIDPALKAAGWGVIEGSRIRREVIAPGRLIGNGKRANPEYSDYVLMYRGEKLAVIEAKKRDLPDTEGKIINASTPLNINGGIFLLPSPLKTKAVHGKPVIISTMPLSTF